jgi:hypothetical protein
VAVGIVTPQRDAFGNPVAPSTARPAATPPHVDGPDAAEASSRPADGPQPSTRWSRKIARRESGRRGAESMILGNPDTYSWQVRLLASGGVRWGLIVLGIALLATPVAGLAVVAFLAASVGFALNGRARRVRRGRRAP